MRVDNIKEINRLYDALLRKDEQFIGIFFVGVKTTGVFCISTCTARKPKKENVEFFTEMKDALRNGFRPCKICKPTEHANEPSEDIVRALRLVKENPEIKISDWQLKQEGLQPEKIRRWFNKNYGITFQTYQRMIRINSAFQDLKKNKKVTDSAFESGYDSLSGFGYTFKKLLGSSPKDIDNKTIILISRTNTRLGPMFICSTDKGICLLEFTDRRMLESEFNDLQNRLQATILAGENEHTAQLKTELEEYFSGKRKTFTVPLDTPGTEFQRSVWNVLQDIPYGKTCSYQEQAEQIQNPKAIRAVATANGMNRISIVIPCHRVIGKDGSLTGYGGGLDRKRWLLDHEKKHLNLHQP